MTDKQKVAIKCAHADLVGSLNDYRDFRGHDWDSHKLSIADLEEAFPELLEDVVYKEEEGD